MAYVIIGAGPAGVVAAETLRKADPKTKITLIGGESEPPYSRMALPYYLIKRVGEDGTHLRHGKSHFKDLKIGIVQDRVIKIDTKGRKVILEKGKPVAFEKLLIATGAQPLNPPIPGIDLDGVHHCWTLEDGRNIAKGAKKGAKVVLMGAGFIGCIILESLVENGVDLSVVEMGDRMVPRMMNETAGNLLKDWCVSKGIKVHTSTSITKIEKGKGKHPLLVDLSSKEKLDADLVISAAGVAPIIDFLEGSGIETDHGILVNDWMATNIEGVFAAGDVAQGRDFSTGEYSVHAIQPTAVEHGRIAALNMAGGDVPYHGSLNMNVLDTMGLISSSFGQWMGVKKGDQAELSDEANFKYINLQFDGDVLIGASTLGLTEHVGILRGLIETRLPLGHWKDALIDNPTRIMEAYIGATRSIG